MKNNDATQHLWQRLKTAHVPEPDTADVAAVMRAVRAIGPLPPPARDLPALAWPTWSYAMAASLMALLAASLVAGMVQWGGSEAVAAFLWAPDFQDLINVVPLVAM